MLVSGYLKEILNLRMLGVLNHVFMMLFLIAGFLVQVC